MTETQADQLRPAKAAATALNTSYSTLRRLLREGKIEYVERKGSGKRSRFFVSDAEIARYEAERDQVHTVTPAAQP